MTDGQTNRIAMAKLLHVKSWRDSIPVFRIRQISTTSHCWYRHYGFKILVPIFFLKCGIFTSKFGIFGRKFSDNNFFPKNKILGDAEAFPPATIPLNGAILAKIKWLPRFNFAHKDWENRLTVTTNTVGLWTKKIKTGLSSNARNVRNARKIGLL